MIDNLKSLNDLFLIKLLFLQESYIWNPTRS